MTLYKVTALTKVRAVTFTMASFFVMSYTEKNKNINSFYRYNSKKFAFSRGYLSKISIPPNLPFRLSVVSQAVCKRFIKPISGITSAFVGTVST